MDKSFIKGLRVLEALAKSDQPRGVADLARELDMTKSNVHRLLSTLVSQSFVQRNATNGTYEAGIKLWELGSQVAGRLDVRKIAAPHLSELKARTGETAHLSILDGHHMVYIDRVETDQYVSTYGRIGARAPAHCTGTGNSGTWPNGDPYCQIPVYGNTVVGTQYVRDAAPAGYTDTGSAWTKKNTPPAGYSDDGTAWVIDLPKVATVVPAAA